MVEKSLDLSSITKKRAFLGKITTAVRKKAALLCMHDEVVLDVGCGNGIFFAQLNISGTETMKFIGLDRSGPLLEESKNIFVDNSVKNVILIKGDIFNLPFKKGQFKRITCLNTILNIPTLEEVEKLLIELVNVCSDDGKIVIDVRNSSNILIKLKYWLHQKRGEFSTIAYSLRDIYEIARKHGFSVKRCLTVGFPLAITASAFVLEINKNSKE